MPHEIIMPALGMAQDTGLIVAWHKAPGDAVAAGDVLMEVETDKSTMEVEAGHDGWIAELRAKAGSEVPVGEVVAVISDSAATPEPPTAAPAEAGVSGPSDQPLTAGTEIIMPALGMAQDSAIIVAWHKAPGDAVAAADVLMEVETDKSTMEVEAGHDGFVAELRAGAGDDVPVGEVIAIISPDRPVTPVETKRAAQDTPVPKAAAPEAVRVPAAANKAQPAPTVPDGRILASPKARRLAKERGLDLDRLARQGVAQPFHVADLDRIAAAPAATAKEAAPGHIAATAGNQAFDEFVAWASAETGDPARMPVLAAFAASVLRAVVPVDGSLTVAVMRAGMANTAYADPDLARLSGLAPREDDTPPALILRDLTGTRITAMRLGGAAVPVLTLAHDAGGAGLAVTLDYPAGTLDDAVAAGLLDDFAARLDMPLRHLL